MDNNHRLVLEELTTFFCDGLPFQTLHPYLIEKGLIGDDIPPHNTNQQNVIALLQLLKRKGPDAYNKFCSALSKAELPWVVDTMAHKLDEIKARAATTSHLKPFHGKYTDFLPDLIVMVK